MSALISAELLRLRTVRAPRYMTPTHLGQLRQQTTRPSDLLLAAGAGQQLVDHLVRDPLTISSLDHRPQVALALAVCKWALPRDLT